jgi:hypothetical protein
MKVNEFSLPNCSVGASPVTISKEASWTENCSAYGCEDKNLGSEKGRPNFSKYYKYSRSSVHWFYKSYIRFKMEF